MGIQSVITPEAHTFANHLRKLYSPEEIKKALAELRISPKELYKYRDDPAGFGIDVLGEYYTPDIIRVMESVRDNRITIARSSNQFGKSQPLTAPVLTPEGYVAIGDLSIGDIVIGRDGKPTQVVGIYPQGLQDTYLVTFNDDSSVEASGDHLWIARSSSDKCKGKPFGFWTTDGLRATTDRTMAIPMCEPVQFPEKNLKIDPYVMGILLGDGILGTCLRFSSVDAWIIDEVACRIKSQFGDKLRISPYSSARYGIAAYPGKKNLAIQYASEYGILGHTAPTKFVPSDYMLASVKQRKELLAGLLDSDGHAGKKGVVTFTSTSRRLAYQVIELVNSLGGTATVSTRRTSYQYRGKKKKGRLSYRVYIKLSFCPFYLPRKAFRWKNPNLGRRPILRVVKNVEYVGKRESVCIQIAHPEGLYLTEQCIVTHNTHCAARLALWFLLMWDDAQVYTASAPPEDNLKRILWGEIGSLIGRRQDLITGFKVRTLHVERSPQSFLTGVAIPTTGTKEERQAKFSGKHSPHLLFIIDEGDAVPDEVYAGIESCMSGGHVRLLIMFNPRRHSGTVWRMERDGEANVIELSAFNHPNVIYGEERVVGAVDRETTVRRINDWTRPLVEGERPGEKCFEVPTFLVGETAKSGRGMQYPPLPAGWREVVEPAFWYMVLGLYPQQDENQLISQEWIDNARVRWDAYVAVNGMVPPQGIRPVQGLDVGEFGPDPNVACFRYGGWVAPFIVWNDMDTDAVADRALELYKEKGCRYAYVDATGYGSNVAPKMGRHGASASGVKVGEGPTMKPEGTDADFLQLRDQLWWMCREWLRTDPGAMLPPDEMLIEELLAPTYNYHGTKRKLKVMSKDAMKDVLKRSPDRADSLCLTFAPTGGWSVGVAQIGR